MGPSSAWIVDYAITSLAFGICIVYACFVGDTFSSLFKGLGLPAFISSREASIVAVTATTLFPLTLLKVRPDSTFSRSAVLRDAPWPYHTQCGPPQCRHGKYTPYDLLGKCPCRDPDVEHLDMFRT